MEKETETVEMAVFINPADYGVVPEKAKDIQGVFSELTIERESLRVMYGQIIGQEITQTLCKQAGELLKKVAKNRIGITKAHKAEKDYFLRGGQFIDAIKNRDIAIDTMMEDRLYSLKTYYEKKEEERLEQLAIDRETELLVYTDVIPAGLGMMLDDVYSYFLEGAKVTYEKAEKAKQDAEDLRIATELAAQVEADRLAKIAADEKIKAAKKQTELEAEIAANKVISDKKEKELIIERKATSDLLKRHEIEATAAQKVIQDAADKKAKAEETRQIAYELQVTKDAKILSDAIEAEKAKTAKLEADAKAIKDAELAKVAAAKIIADNALKAPDKDKLTIWVDSLVLGSIKLSENAKSKAVGNSIFLKLKELKVQAKALIETI